MRSPWPGRRRGGRGVFVSIGRIVYTRNVIQGRVREGEPRSGARALLSGASWQASSQVAPLVINLALTPYIITGLGPARYSVFLLVSSLSAILSQFDGGIGQSALRFFTLNFGRDDKVATTRMLTTLGSLIAVVGVCLTLAAIVLTDQVLGFFGLADELVWEAAILLRVLCALVGALLLRNVFNSVLLAAGLFRLTAIAIMLGYVVYVIGLVLTVEFGWGLPGIAVTMILQQIVGTLVTVPASIRLLDRRGVGWMNRADLRVFFRYAWRVQVTGLVVMVQAHKDQLVAGRVLSAQLSGPYGQGSNFASQLRQLPLNALAPIQANIGSRVGALGPDAAVATAERLQRVWVRLICCWCVIGVPTTYVGVRAWLPDSFALASSVAAILLAGSMFPLSIVVIRVWALTLGHSEIELRASLAGLVINVIVSLALYQVFGLLGVVAGTAISQTCSALIYSWLASRILPVAPGSFIREIPWWQAVVCGLLVTLCQLYIAPYLPRGVLGLLAAAAVGTPTALLLLVLALRRSGLRDARAALRRH